MVFIKQSEQHPQRYTYEVVGCVSQTFLLNHTTPSSMHKLVLFYIVANYIDKKVVPH